MLSTTLLNLLFLIMAFQACSSIPAPPPSPDLESRPIITTFTGALPLPTPTLISDLDSILGLTHTSTQIEVQNILGVPESQSKSKDIDYYNRRTLIISYRKPLMTISSITLKGPRTKEFFLQKNLNEPRLDFLNHGREKLIELFPNPYFQDHRSLEYRFIKNDQTSVQLIFNCDSQGQICPGLFIRWKTPTTPETK